VKAEISYGKAGVTFYRVYATPLSGLRQIPESSFTGRKNTLVAVDVDVEVFGNNFLPAYTHGDNSNVVATDSMKNFVLKQALAFEGATLEAFLYFLGQEFLRAYPEMQRLRLSAREQSFVAARVPQDGSFTNSDVLFSRAHGDYSSASLEMECDGDTLTVIDHRCGRVGLQLIKITGSSFTRFVRDQHTTLPERTDRPLFIHMDVDWKYADVAQAIGSDTSQYVAAEQVRDFVQVVFHEFVSESIQHLVHEMGQRLLERFPQIVEVSFDAENHTPDPVAESSTDSKVKVYTHPFPAYGLIKLKLTRDEL
jgi:urate oxidase